MILMMYRISRFTVSYFEEIRRTGCPDSDVKMDDTKDMEDKRMSKTGRI